MQRKEKGWKQGKILGNYFTAPAKAWLIYGSASTSISCNEAG